MQTSLKQVFHRSVSALSFIVLIAAVPAQAQDIKLITIAPDGSAADERSYNPSFSEDGQYILFETWARNLVQPDVSSANEVLLFDRSANSFERVAMGDFGQELYTHSSNAVMTSDNRYIAYQTGQQIFVYDRQLQVRELVTVGIDSLDANNSSYAPSISADGRYVVFTSNATNLVAADTNGLRDAFLRDRQAQTTIRISQAPGGAEADDYSAWARVTSDGSEVLFSSEAGNLIPNDNDGKLDVFSYSMADGSLSLISKGFDGLPGNNVDNIHDMSPDGRFVLVSSKSTNIVQGSEDSTFTTLFLYDRQANTVEKVPFTETGEELNSHTGAAAVSDDGRFVVFNSSADNIVIGDNNGRKDVFLRDMSKQTTRLLSMNLNGDVGNEQSSIPDITADGQFVVFGSFASDLVANDFNTYKDIFVVSTTEPNEPPIANAGVDQSIFLGTSAELDGFGSYDPNGDTLTYSWSLSTKPAGSLAELSGSDVTANFTPDLAGSYQASLTVNDGQVSSPADLIEVTVIDPLVYAADNVIAARDIVAGLTRSDFDNRKRQSDLTGYLNNAVSALQQGDITGAVGWIDEAITRVDGCTLNGAPDLKGKAKDWVVNCSAQISIYDLLIEAKSVL